MYKIGDFSRKVSVPVKTLRYYDEINLFKPSYIDDFIILMNKLNK